MARGATSKSRADLRKAVALEVANPGDPSKSKQPEATDRWTPSNGVRPPLDLDQLAGLTAISRTRRSCIAAITLNTVGLGFRVEVRKGHEEELAADDEQMQVEEHLDELAREDRRLGQPSFTRLLSAAKWDQYEVGNGYIEVSRNQIDGQIDGLFHAPGKRIRRRSDRAGYIMGRRGATGAELTRFYEFGDKVQYDEAGRPTATLRPGRRWDTNELIPLRLYTSASRDYGLPPDYPLAVDYLGDKLAGQANVGYFDHSGVPPTVIFVKGREEEADDGTIEVVVDQSFVAAITDTLKAQGGRGRVAVVPVPAGVETEKHDLAVLSERDIGFVAFRSDNRRATLGAYRLSPIFVADIEDAGKYTAEVERAITKEQVFDPDQRETADILGQTLVRELAPHLQIVFEGIAIKGDEARRQSANDAADRGSITFGEFREAHGYPPLPEAKEQGEFPATGEVPFGWNKRLMPRGSVPADAGVADPLAKGSVEDDLARELVGEFDRSLDDAIAAVQREADAELRPVVVTKRDDGSFTVEPYEASMNGGGPE